MDKVYITKDELKKSINTRRKEAGPILTAFAYLGIIVTGLWAIPLVVFWMLLLITYLPFFILDSLLTRSKK